MNVSISFKKQKRRKYTKIKDKLSDELIYQTISEHIKLFETDYPTLPIEISLETLLIPAKKKKTFKKPPNPFILYRKYLRFTILSQNKNASMNQISKLSSKMWNEASSEIKCFFHNLSKVVARAYEELNSYTNGKDFHISTKESKYLSYTFPVNFNSSDLTHDDVIIPSNTLDSELINDDEQIYNQQENNLISDYTYNDNTYIAFPNIYSYDGNFDTFITEFNLI